MEGSHHDKGERHSKKKKRNTQFVLENQQQEKQAPREQQVQARSLASMANTGTSCTNDDALQSKREYNRISAAKSREKRKRTLEEMRAKVERTSKKFQKLKNENDSLRKEIRSLLESNQLLSSEHLPSSKKAEATSTDDSEKKTRSKKAKRRHEKYQDNGAPNKASKDNENERCSSLSS